MVVNKTALSLMAHPDDAEFTCAGTLALLRERGWEIDIATMTPGDCGSAEFDREEISRIRKGEAAGAARILDAAYHCLECEDVFIMYDKATLLKVIALLRKVRPTIVFAPSPSDYMVDHEMTSKVVQTACFAVAYVRPCQELSYPLGIICGSEAIISDLCLGSGAISGSPYLYHLFSHLSKHHILRQYFIILRQRLDFYI